jgi:hypothetical protein
LLIHVSRSIFTWLTFHSRHRHPQMRLFCGPYRTRTQPSERSTRAMLRPSLRSRCGGMRSGQKSPRQGGSLFTAWRGEGSGHRRQGSSARYGATDDPCVAAAMATRAVAGAWEGEGREGLGAVCLKHVISAKPKRQMLSYPCSNMPQIFQSPSPLRFCHL